MSTGPSTGVFAHYSTHFLALLPSPRAPLLPRRGVRCLSRAFVHHSRGDHHRGLSCLALSFFASLPPASAVVNVSTASVSCLPLCLRCRGVLSPPSALAAVASTPVEAAARWGNQLLLLLPTALTVGWFWRRSLGW